MLWKKYLTLHSQNPSDPLACGIRHANAGTSPKIASFDRLYLLQISYIPSLRWRADFFLGAPTEKDPQSLRKIWWEISQLVNPVKYFLKTF